MAAEDAPRKTMSIERRGFLKAIFGFVAAQPVSKVASIAVGLDFGCNPAAILAQQFPEEWKIGSLPVWVDLKECYLFRAPRDGTD